MIERKISYEVFTIVLAAMTIITGAALAAGYPDLPPPRLGGGGAAAPPAAVSSGDTRDTAAAPAVPARPLPVVTISAAVDVETVPMNDNVRLTVVAVWEESADDPAEPLDFEFPEQPSADGLTLFANSFRSVTELSGATVKTRREYTYDFHAPKIMDTEIRPFKIDYFRIGSGQKKQLSTQAIPVKVVKPRINIGEVMRRPAAKAVLIVVMVIAGAALAFMTIRSKRKRAPVETAPEKTRHELARERLKEADRLRMAGDYAGFIRAVYEETRSYLEDVMEIKSRGLAPDALAKSVAEKLGGDWGEVMAEFERLCGEVRFAGHEPRGGDMDMALDTAKKLVGEGEKKDRTGRESEDDA